MYSVFVHLVNVTRPELADWFDSRAVQGLREHWYFPNRNDPVFSVRFPHAGAEFKEQGVKERVSAVMGRTPDISVEFDGGGKHPGHKEMRKFLVELLGEYSGVAVDDLSSHVWTVEDLRADTRINGFAFADHESFRKHAGAHHVTHPKPASREH
jgi:hypothetical protein